MTGFELHRAIPQGPKFLADARGWTTAQLLGLNTTTKRASVSINSGPAVSLPYVDCGAAAYAGITTVFVLLDPLGSGSGQLVLGPCGTQALPPDAPPPAVPVTRTFKTTIRPTASGTWSNKWGRFDAWNQGRYGGSSTLYQASAFGSGTLEGIAVYGNQIKALGADAITSAVLHLPLATGSGTVQVQGTSQGVLANPAPSGATASGTASANGTIALGSTMRDDLRTGASKGLCLTGAAYLAIYGTAIAKGMALSITYTRST